MCMGGVRARRLSSRGHRGFDRGLRRCRHEYLPDRTDTARSCPDRYGGRLPAYDRQRQRFPLHARFLQAQHARPKHDYSDGVFDVTGGRARRLSCPAERRMRPGPRWRSFDSLPAKYRLPIPGGHDLIPGRPLPPLRCRREWHKAERRRGDCSPEAPVGRHSRPGHRPR